MILDEQMYTALSGTGYPVTQRPVKGTAPVYLTWTDTMGTATGWSSNKSTRINHMITVDIFSRDPSPRAAFIAVLHALSEHGITPISWGPVDYESATRWYHLPITCRADEVYDI